MTDAAQVPTQGKPTQGVQWTTELAQRPQDYCKMKWAGIYSSPGLRNLAISEARGDIAKLFPPTAQSARAPIEHRRAVSQTLRLAGRLSWSRKSSQSAV